MVGGRVCPLRFVVFVHGQRRCARSNLAGISSGICATSATDFVSQGPFDFTDFRIFCCIGDFHQLVAVTVNLHFHATTPVRFTAITIFYNCLRIHFHRKRNCNFDTHSILEFLYTPDTVNLDIIQFGRTAAACWLSTSRWTQVDTPSIATQDSCADSTP